jgi:hypothetical protein
MKECTEEQLKDLDLLTPLKTFCIKLNSFEMGSISLNFQQCSEMSEALYNYVISNNDTCNRDDNDISMKNVEMFVFVPELGFKPNLEYPFFSIMSYYQLTFASIFMTSVKIPINLYYLEDDIGWMMKDVQSKTDIDMSDQKLGYVSVNETKFPQVQFMINVGSRYKKYSRSYVKFQDFLAVIGGFMKLVLTILNIGLIYAKNYLIDMHIISTQFSNREKSDKAPGADNTVNQSNLSKQKLKKELINNFVEIKIAKDTESPHDLKPTKKITLSKYTKALIFNTFGCKSKNDKDIDILRKKLKAVDKLQDYDMILKKVNEIEVMKKLLFSDTQLLCFDFLEKPNCITNEENALSRSLSLLVTQQDQKKDNLINKFVKLISEETLDGTDEKFFKMLDDDVKQDIFKKLNK